MMEELFQMADRIMQPILNDMRVQCKACPYDNACCFSMVALTKDEAELIVDYLHKTNQWDMVRMKLYRQRQFSPSHAQMMKDVHTPQPDGLAWKWFRRKQYCALYDTETKQCRVYPVRPINCRALFAELGTNCAAGESTTTEAMMPLQAQSILYQDTPDVPPSEQMGELASMVLRAEKRMH